jgi:hypothetical protein
MRGQKGRQEEEGRDGKAGARTSKNNRLKKQDVEAGRKSILLENGYGRTLAISTIATAEI